MYMIEMKTTLMYAQKPIRDAAVEAGLSGDLKTAAEQFAEEKGMDAARAFALDHEGSQLGKGIRKLSDEELEEMKFRSEIKIRDNQNSLISRINSLKKDIEKEKRVVVEIDAEVIRRKEEGK